MGNADFHIESELQCTGAARSLYSFLLSSEVLTVKFSPERDYCAAGLCSGSIQLIALPHKHRKSQNIELIPDDESLPCTDFVFVPKQGDKKKILAVYASGFVRLWQYHHSGKFLLVRRWKEHEYNVQNTIPNDPKYNQTICVDVSTDGKRFVTGGSDTVIRAYDMSPSPGRLLVPSIRTDMNLAHNFHTNRVTAIIYHPRGQKDAAFAHYFISASWDGTIQGWDDRTCGSLWQRAGTTVSGADGLFIDPVRNVVLSACYKHDKVLSQIWDASFSNLDVPRPIQTLDKPLLSLNQEVGGQPVQIYVVIMTPDHQYTMFGGTNGNVFKIINTTTQRQVASVLNLPNGVYSADCCADPSERRRILVAFTNGLKVHLLSFDPRSPNYADIH